MNQATTQKKKIYSVSEITRDIRLLLEGSFQKVWIEGEVSNFILHTSGHCYFSLKDNESVLACVLFKNSAYKIRFKIENGMSLVCRGRISVYDKRGQYQLYVEEIEPKGIGSLQLAFTQLKEKLSKEGLFNEEHKLLVPYLPERIGIVTSPTGAAVRDMIHVLERRFPNMHIILYPANVQGEGAAQEIKEGIEAFNRLNNVDIIIAGRGGGSLEDLWAFNEEIVARAIFDSKIPIISAVGHEIDYTIADFVADMRAPTPSAAAEIVVHKKEDMIEEIEYLREKLKTSLINRLDMLKRHLDNIMQRYAFKQPQFLTEQYQQRLDEHTKLLSQSLTHFLEIKRQNHKAIEGKLNALSPTAILSRGYSITMTYPSGDILKDSANVKKNTRIRTKLAKGEIISKAE
ncbi:MAG: exodeoxyribonuclease VII large subunit [Candidatus Omnitrophica bacterium]|nr:exodeoxyribonuclease VII large subunit [Candidatus Omnitrophota bacterium]